MNRRGLGRAQRLGRWRQRSRRGRGSRRSRQLCSRRRGQLRGRRRGQLRGRWRYLQRRRLGFFFVQPGYDFQREPLVHALLPEHGVFVDHLQSVKIVYLLERQNLFLTRGDADAPKVTGCDAHWSRIYHDPRTTEEPPRASCLSAMGKNAFEDMDPDLSAMRASMRPSAGPMRWGRVLTGVLVVGCATFAFAFYVPLMRAHEALTKQFLSLQSQVDSANRSVQDAQAQAKEAQEQKQALQEQLTQAKQVEKSGTDASAAVKTALESKLQKPAAKDQAAVGTADGQAVATLSLNYLLTRGKLEVSPDGKTALCGVATASNKRAIRVLAIADKKSIPATLAAKLKTPLDYGGAVSALVAQTLLDKCSVDAANLSATSFPAEPAASAKIAGKKLSGPRVELWLDTAK